MKTLKNVCLVALLAVFVQPSWADDIRVVLNASSGPIVPGEWNTNFKAGLEYAEKNHVPMLLLWGNTGCSFCLSMARDCLEPEFVAWQQERKIVMVVVEAESEAKAWVKQPRTDLSAYPFVRIYWKKPNGTVSTYNWTGRNSAMPYYETYAGDPKYYQLMQSVEMYIKGWEPTPPVSFGELADPDTEYNRLEAEAGTTSVDVRLTRPEGTTAPTNAVVAALKPDGKTTFWSQPIAWAEGESNRVVTIDLAKAGFAKSGDKVTVVVKDPAGQVVSSNHVTYVTGNSASNPNWLGEPVEFGEWTMDFEAAKKKVAGAAGDAYTLIDMMGALWCPDCAWTDLNFLDLPEFEAWAKDTSKRSLALVTMDTANYPALDDTPPTSATLLSRKAFTSSLPQVPDSEERVSAVRSGLGYLTRKMVSDEVAAELYATNKLYAQSNAYFHRLEDYTDKRPPIPVFILLDKKGRIAGRFITFDDRAYSPKNTANMAAYLRRFDEMVANAADTTEVDNDDARTTTLKLDAFGGAAESTIAHADARDTYELTGVQNGALIRITARGGAGAETVSAPVRLVLQRRDSATGVTVDEVASVEGNLKDDGLKLESRLEQKGVYYVQIQSDIASPEFNVTNAESTVRSYALSSLAVLTPVQSEAVKANPGTAAMGMRVVSNEVYRLVGFANPAADGAFEKVDGADGNLWRALVSDDVPLKAADPEGTVRYQQWVPGVVGFESGKFAKPVKESAGEVVIPFRRTNGVSGSVTVTVIHDITDPRAVIYDSDGEKRYVDMDPVVVTWKDGESGETNLCFRLKDDTRHDGNGRFIFKLSENSGSAEIDHAEFVLDVEEDDPQSAGLAAFTGAEPYLMSGRTVYVKAGEKAVLHADRVRASDGPAAVAVSTTRGDLDVTRLEWGNHRFEQKTVELSGLEAGEVAVVTLSDPEGGLQVDVDRQTVRVVAVAADGPEFEVVDNEQSLIVRYVDLDATVPLKADTIAEDADIEFVKLSGTLPAGLSVGWDGESGMYVRGVPTKAGEYEIVYQAVANLYGLVTIPGTTTRLRIRVVDIAEPFSEKEPAPNPSLAETRTFSDVMVRDPATKRLAGLLQVTIPPTGKISAKYVCASGTVAFACPCWSIPPETDNLKEGAWTMSTLVEPVRPEFAGFALGVYARPNGTVDITVQDPSYEDALEASVSGAGWSKDHPATAWKGTYTVAAPVTDITDDPMALAPTGSGFLVLKCDDAASFVSGRMLWSGALPDGTTVSGSATLTEGTGFADLPVCFSSLRDRFAGVARIEESALDKTNATRRTVYSPADCIVTWKHAERPLKPDLAYEAELRFCGGIYDSAHDKLKSCCEESYESSLMALYAPETDLDIVPLVIGDTTIALERGYANPHAVSLGFSRATGIVSGSFRMTHPGSDMPVVAQWRGIVLIGWGSGCGCGESETSDLKPDMPFVNGFWTFTDRIGFETDESGTMRQRAYYLNHSGSVSVDKRPVD